MKKRVAWKVFIRHCETLDWPPYQPQPSDRVRGNSLAAARRRLFSRRPPMDPNLDVPF